MTTVLSLRAGDRLPDFALAGLDGKLRKLFWSFTGESVALLVIDDLRMLDIEQFAGLVKQCRAAATVVVVICGNAVAAASPAWSKIESMADGALLLCDGERKVVPALLAQAGMALGQTGGLRQRVI